MRVLLTKIGWLSLADNGPRRGTLELCPDIKLTTAYILLRPFFDQYGRLDMESTYFYGADPGMGQVVKDSWHPALRMDKTIISVPDAGPGDYVFWHCDVWVPHLAKIQEPMLTNCRWYTKSKKHTKELPIRLLHTSPSCH